MNKIEVEYAIFNIIYKITNRKIDDFYENLLGYNIDLKPNEMAYTVLDICDEFEILPNQFIERFTNASINSMSDIVISIKKY